VNQHVNGAVTATSDVESLVPMPDVDDPEVTILVPALNDETSIGPSSIGDLRGSELETSGAGRGRPPPFSRSRAGHS
jgi:hypothetical protein